MAGKGCICGMFVGERGVWDRGEGGRDNYYYLAWFYVIFI